MVINMKLFISCSSQDTIKEEYKEQAKSLAEILSKDNDLVFGAYNKGLMGLSYDIAKKNNRKVIGICPEVYK